jgi:hypothetical protein
MMMKSEPQKQFTCKEKEKRRGGKLRKKRRPKVWQQAHKPHPFAADTRDDTDEDIHSPGPAGPLKHPRQEGYQATGQTALEL